MRGHGWDVLTGTADVKMQWCKYDEKNRSTLDLAEMAEMAEAAM